MGLLFIVLAYFIPTAVAFGRGVPNKGSVLVVNLFFGWSVVGWVIALAMAARSR
ncbi:superinfection immunity protein [Streptomyces sp. NPDC001586]|uniref:superinfection immunity protein n=1 Tax=unclassified Streptomyces TaxID=2593676 RepID=UPI003328B20B